MSFDFHENQTVVLLWLLSAQKNPQLSKPTAAGSIKNNLSSRDHFLPTESIICTSLDIHVLNFLFTCWFLKVLPQDLESLFLKQSLLCSTADFFWTYTGDQKSNKPAGQSPNFYLLVAYIRSYHFFNIWEKHVTKVFCCFYRKLCWQIINGTHQNTRAFNTERENTAPLNNFSFILVLILFLNYFQWWFSIRCFTVQSTKECKWTEGYLTCHE